jgi:hypothetical protein
LTATIPASDIAADTTARVSVANTSSQGIAAAVPFVVAAYNSSVATIQSVAIGLTADGSGNHAVTLTGKDILPLASLQWGGFSPNSSYLGTGGLAGTITSGEYSTRPVTVTVTNLNASGASPGFVIY